MTIREHSSVWVCTDCYFAHHHGAEQRNGKWYAGETLEPAEREPLAYLLDEGVELADNTDSETGEGMREFSWSQCDGCGSTLGGSRYRLAVFNETSK